MGQVEDTSESAVAATPAYAYKASLMGAPWEFRLEPDRLVWVVGRRQGEIFYRDIRRVRLSFRPATMQSYRFIAEIWAPGAPKLTIASTSWHGIAEQRRQDQPYRDFIVALHQRIAAAKSNPLLDAGTHPFLYWPGVVVFAALAIGIVALLVSALRQNSWGATLFLTGFFALLLWQIGGFFRRNHPGRYVATAIPENVLPKSKG
jgi:hypothetical protein